MSGWFGLAGNAVRSVFVRLFVHLCARLKRLLRVCSVASRKFGSHSELCQASASVFRNVLSWRVLIFEGNCRLKICSVIAVSGCSAGCQGYGLGRLSW